jgi:hypothetical protein
MLVMQSPGLENAIVEIHSMRILFDPQEKLEGKLAYGLRHLLRDTSLVAAEQ